MQEQIWLLGLKVNKEQINCAGNNVPEAHCPGANAPEGLLMTIPAQLLYIVVIYSNVSNNHLVI